MMKVLLAFLAGLVGFLGLTGGALAAPPDYSSLTTAVDFSTTIAAVMAVAALIAGLYLAIRGAKTILAFIRPR